MTRRPFFAEISEKLCESIEHSIRFHSADENGETRAERYARFDMAHHVPDEPEVPEYIGYLAEWFWQLSSRRKSGMGGPEPIGYADIATWRDLTACDPTPEEICVLIDMDNAYMAAVAKEQRDKAEAAKKRQR